MGPGRGTALSAMPDMPNQTPNAVDLEELTRLGAQEGIAATHLFAKISGALFEDDAKVAVKIADRYTLLDKLGTGANGEVYAAYDNKLERKVAFKVLRLPGGSSGGARLEREAQALAKINHPHVVQVHDVGMHKGEVFLTMELVKGEPLDDWAKTRKPSLDQRLDVLIAVGQGLAVVHAQGILHRDIKPANILVDEQGRPRLADFGIARSDLQSSTSATDLQAPPHASGTLPTTMTHGAGTPDYMSPEQCEGRVLDASSDQFGFCVVVWETVYGVHPFRAGDPAAQRARILAGNIEPLGKMPGMPPRLEEVLRRGLAKDPRGRFPGMKELVAELTAIRNPPRRSRTGWMLLGGGALGIFAAAMYGQAAAGHCEMAAEQVAEVWSGERATAIRAAFAASGEGPAAAVGEKVVERLDAFAGKLQAAMTANCVAHDDKELSETQYHNGQQCLEERRLALADAVRALSVAGPGLLVVDPLAVSEELGDVAQCEDRDYLAAAVAGPPEASRPAVEAVAALRRKGDMELVRGEFKAAEKTFTQAVADARLAGYAPETSRALYDLSRTYLRLGRSDDAELLLHQAQTLADGAGDDYAAADAVLLMFNVAVEKALIDESERRYAEVSAKLQRTGRNRGGPRGELELVRTALLMSNKQLDEAKRVFAEAERDLADPAMAPGLWQVDLWRTRSVLARLTGDKQAAAEAAQKARDAMRVFVGTEDHPLFAVSLAREEIFAGELEAAAKRLERVRGVLERSFGSESAMMAQYYVTLALLHEARGEEEGLFAAVMSAERLLPGQRVDSMLVRTFAEVVTRLGWAWRSRGRVEEALALYDRGIKALTGVRAPAYDSTFAVFAASRADILLKRMDDPNALYRAQEDVTAALERFPIEQVALDPAIMTFVLRVASDVAFARGDLASTRKRAEEALVLLNKYPEPETSMRVSYTLAQALGWSDPRAKDLAGGAIDYLIGIGRSSDAREIGDWLDDGQFNESVEPTKEQSSG